MNNNIGKIDRSLRILTGVLVIVWGVLLENMWGALGIVFVITGLVKWCPLYLLFGIKTCNKESNLGSKNS